MAKKKLSDLGSATREKINALVSLLAQNPWASDEEQAEVLGGIETRSLKTWHTHLKDLGYAPQVNPVLDPRRTDKAFRRLWVFLQTEYDRDLNREEAADTEQAAIQFEQHQYQEYVREALRRKVTKPIYAKDLRIISMDILFGGAEWDIVFILEARRIDTAHRFVIEEVRTTPYVKRSSTMLALAR